MSAYPPPSPKVQQIDNVLLHLRTQPGCHRGSLNLTSHHLIFYHSAPSGSQHHTSHLIPYSLIAQATRLPSLRTASTSNGAGSRVYPIAFHGKDFDACALGFATEAAQLEVFESVKHCAVLVDASQLYAFYYQPQPQSSAAAADSSSSSGWRIYDAKREFARQGLGSRTKAWRLTDINAQYDFCPSYPALMAIPSRISDATLGYACKYRSKARIPALSYLHWANHGSITRSSQPMVGLKNARSIQDEKLIEAIFTSHHFADPDSITAKAAAEATANAAASGGVSTLAVYGATSTNLIVDARPTTNAMANVARGAGTENMEYYKGCKKAYLGIDNIHVMRDSLNRLTDALRESEPAPSFDQLAASAGSDGPSASADASAATVGPDASVSRGARPIDPQALRKSSWLKHISTLLEGTMTITRNIHINSSHVLIHCSDGWDRTSQLAALAELCLDPYYRTFDGFAVLIEKDWLSFGHRFSERGGYKSNDKCFVTSTRHASGGAGDTDDRGSDNSDTEGERGGAGPEAASGGGGGFDGQAAANAFWGFTKQLTANFGASSSSSQPAGPHRGSHIKETSPVFHQFLDCTWQIMRQFPQRFEFDEAFLVETLRASQECKYGTFLMDCERERLAPKDEEGRAQPPLPTRTVSVWDHLLSGASRKAFRNPRYDPELDSRDPKRSGTDMGVLFIDPRDVRYFERLFKRESQEMNAALEKEAEERRRARERLERAVRGEGAASPAASATNIASDKGELSGVTIATVGPGDKDPVLDAVGVNGIGAALSQAVAPSPSTNNAGSQANSADQLSASPSFGPGSTGNPPGAVDLSKGKVDPSRLGYEVRKAKTMPRSGMTPSGSSTSLASTPGAGANGVDLGASAGDAANRMKNLFLGGWGRLQDAVNGSPTAAQPDGRASTTTAAPPSAALSHNPWGQQDPPAGGGAAATTSRMDGRPPHSGRQASTGPLAGADDVPLRAATGTTRPSAPGGSGAGIHNPWAANTEWRREMALEQDRIAGLGQTVGGSRINPASSSSTMGGGQAGEAEREDKAPLDPLGVL